MHEWIDVHDRCHAARDGGDRRRMFGSQERWEKNVISTRTIRVVAMTALISAGILTSGLINAPGAGAAAKPKLVVTPSTG